MDVSAVQQHVDGGVIEQVLIARIGLRMHPWRSSSMTCSSST
jgi:hypothetical protein